MKARELNNLGVPNGEPLKLGVRACARAAEAGLSREALRAAIQGVIENPAGYADDPIFDRFARALLEHRAVARPVPVRAGDPAPYRIWGEGLEAGAISQLTTACQLPVAAAAALMPDAHIGYGLPIGGVLAAENAVIPYAVGVDIACRMRMTIVDIDPGALDDAPRRDALVRALESQTAFGVGASLKRREQHDVLDADWSVSPITHRNKDKAWAQLGSSGSGNHFVEWGVLTVSDGPRPAFETRSGSGAGSGWAFDLPAGRYLALLSHSGSRGTGAAVCDHYSRLAMDRLDALPKELKQLAWLSLDSHEGQEYWLAMNLMGQYAAANHETIHRRIVRDLGCRALAHVENHHNFAWKERHDAGDGRGERELIVHRKGATPAGAGVLGVIPGSMTAPGFVVVGLGGAGSLRSASHGAGRAMSRTRARESFVWGNVRRQLDDLGVQVLSAGLDEVPGAYKDIHAVMASQADLVAPIARFDPKIVKMAPEGERPED